MKGGMEKRTDGQRGSREGWIGGGMENEEGGRDTHRATCLAHKGDTILPVTDFSLSVTVSPVDTLAVTVPTVCHNITCSLCGTSMAVSTLTASSRAALPRVTASVPVPGVPCAGNPPAVSEWAVDTTWASRRALHGWWQCSRGTASGPTHPSPKTS